MILAIGLLSSVYFSFLSMPTGVASINKGGLMINRIISMVLIYSIAFEAIMSFNVPQYYDLSYPLASDSISFLDGSILFQPGLSGSFLLIFIYFLALIILQLAPEIGSGRGIGIGIGTGGDSVKGGSGSGSRSGSGSGEGSGSGSGSIGIRAEVSIVASSSLVGITYILSSNDWLVTIVAWELMNLSLYLLVSMQRAGGRNEFNLSASIKYFLLSAYTTSMLLLSVALLYGYTGTTNYDGLIMIAQTGQLSMWPFYFMIISFAFKIGAAPLHSWAPDLYDSLPTYATLWMIIIPKTAVLFLMVKLGYMIGPIELIGTNIKFSDQSLFMIFGFISMLVGSFALATQWKIKRFLAYSSIAAIGFILITLNNPYSAYFFIMIYMITVMVTFIILLSMGTSTGREIEYISDLSGLYRVNPALAYALAICFFSLAGTPPLMGFYGKLEVLLNLVDQELYSVIIVMILSSVLSAINYLSIVLTTHLGKPLGGTGLYNETLSICYYKAILISVGIGFITLGAFL